MESLACDQISHRDGILHARSPGQGDLLLYMHITVRSTKVRILRRATCTYVRPRQGSQRNNLLSDQRQAGVSARSDEWANEMAAIPFDSLVMPVTWDLLKELVILV